MLALSQSRSLRLLAFGALYLAQGVPAGFLFVGYVVFLTDQGLSNEAIGGAVGLMSIPLALKLVWALVIDRFPSRRFGRRRPFIIGAELGMGLSLLTLLFLDPKRDLSLISGVLILYSTFVSVQDVATDAMAVDLLQTGERGTANGVMWASKSVGITVGGGGGSVVAKHLGWPALIVIITAILWAVMALVLFLRERPRAEEATAERSPRLTLAELRRSFAFSTPIVGAAIALFTPVGPALISTVFTRMLRADLKLSLEAIGLLAGVIEPISGIAGALLGGVLADRLGTRRVLGFMMAAFGATLGLFALTRSLWTSFPYLVGCSIAVQVFGCASGAAMAGLFMRLANPAVGATQLAIFMSLSGLSNVWGAPLGGRIADAYGAHASYAAAAVLQVVFIGLLPFCDPRATEARFRAEPAVSPGGPLEQERSTSPLDARAELRHSESKRWDA